jgi:hypothetical protein
VLSDYRWLPLMHCIFSKVLLEGSQICATG